MASPPSDGQSVVTTATSDSCYPFVSVIIPIYNGLSELSDLGRCLLSQTYPPDRVEYLLVDNNSQDGTAEGLQTLAAQGRDRGIQIYPLAEMTIQSSYAARNQGIWAARGEILAFTDADCRPQPDWLAQLILPFQDPQVGLVAGEVAALPGNSLLEQYANYRETLSQKFTLAHPFAPYGQTANLAIRRSALEKAGLFRPYLTTGGDADLCWRIQQSGNWQIRFAEAAIVRHHHRDTLAGLASQWRRYGCSNQYLHALHGVDLGPTLTAGEVRKRLGRWLWKDLPKFTWQALRGRVPPIAILAGPLDLFCARSRAIGQQQATLPEAAWSFPQLNDRPSRADL